jgi:predicted ester cyclase
MMHIQENKALVRRYLIDVTATGNMDLPQEIFAPDFVAHLPNGDLPGLEPLRAYLTAFRAVFPDARYAIEEEIVEGENVAARWRWEGTHDGPFQEIAPTGKRVSQTGTTLFRVSGSKIVEAWPQADFLGLMQQIGATLQAPNRDTE